jgi:flagellar biogenesis protein FliO
MDLARQVESVILVIGLLAGLLMFGRRKGLVQLVSPVGRSRARLPRQLEVVERISLNPNQALHLVRIGDKQLLIATSPGACQLMEMVACNSSKSTLAATGAGA